AHFRRVLNHDVKSVRACLFAKSGPRSNVATDECLQRSANVDKEISRANDDATNHPEILHYAIVWNFKGSGHHLMRNRITWWTYRIRYSLHVVGPHHLPPRAVLVDLRLYKVTLGGRFARDFGFHKKVCRSHPSFLSNTTPSLSNNRCCLSCGNTMCPVEHAPWAFSTRCHGV